MKLSYKLSAAVFCMTVGVAAAAALPNWTTGMIAGACLLALGAVLLGSAVRQGAQCVREAGNARQEQQNKLLADLQRLLEQLDTDIKACQREIQQASEQSEEALMAEMKQLKKQLSEAVSEMEKTISEKAATAETQRTRQLEQLCELDKTVEETADSLYDRQKNRLAEVKKAVEQLNSDMADKLDELNDSMTEKLDTLADDRQNQFDELGEKIEEQAGDVKAAAETGLENARGEIISLRGDLNDLKKAADNTMNAFKTSSDELGQKLEMFPAKAEESMKRVTDEVQDQLKGLEECLKKENAENRASTERIMEMYASVTEQDAKVLSSLGIKGAK